MIYMNIITIDNVKYKLNQTTQTAKVIYAKNQKVITIPNSISNKKVTYTVNSIAESAFEDNDKLNKLSKKFSRGLSSALILSVP